MNFFLILSISLVYQTVNTAAYHLASLAQGTLELVQVMLFDYSRVYF